ncbi:hypothetical protein F5148DRAFT_1345672 [Russula earlei]|uniref:Uncharacterized protein n=1 Tax=Russula earlei TaxID=71964 RepID=A0ACC0UFA3_9AGAM|nr:hypothetical protein F5148DRAFT_1345672 [Russula earlei]
MVSDIFQACSDGDLTKVNQILAQASPLDIEEKDQDGVTPLITAVKNGHRDVVKALLGHGANPAHPSTQGLPEQYTSDATIVELLRTAAIPKVNADMPLQDPRFIHDPNMAPPKAYYMPHPGPYAYYPGIPVPSLPEGAMPYYPPPPAPPASAPPSADDQSPPLGSSNVSNLPPPEIARLIPCRYFPACRYGASCIFAHPQGPYYPGPMPPPAQYPTPFEQPPYPHNFYPIPGPPPQFQPPNGVPPHHLSPVSPQSAAQPIPPLPPQFVHQRNTSEIVPPLQIPFNPPGAPVPPPGPYGPLVPCLSLIPLTNIILSRSLSLRPLPIPLPKGRNRLPRLSRKLRRRLSRTSATLRHLNTMVLRNHLHRKVTVRVAIVARAGAQVFAGRRFLAAVNHLACSSHLAAAETEMIVASPHVLADGHVVGRGGRSRPPQNAINGNGEANLEEKLANLSITENGNQLSRQGSSGSTTPSERGPRGANGTHVRPSKSTAAPQKQRVPNADEFPVLGGSATPPQVNGHTTHTGPTAAQVLQAPAVRKEPSKSDASTIEGQDQFRPIAGQAVKHASQDVMAPSSAPVSVPSHKLPVSFAAVANGAPDTSKEVSVSA